MSKNMLIQTTYTDAKAMQTALERMFPGMQVVAAENPFQPSLTCRDYYNNPMPVKSSFVVKLRGQGNYCADLGYTYAGDGTFTAQFDHLDHFDFAKIGVEYQVAFVEQQYPEWTIDRINQPNGDVELVLVEPGA